MATVIQPASIQRDQGLFARMAAPVATFARAHLLPSTRTHAIHARRYPLAPAGAASDNATASASLGHLLQRQTVLMVSALLSVPHFGATALFATLLGALFIVNATRLVLSPSALFLQRQRETSLLSLVIPLLPIIAGVMLGRGFLLLALMIVALDFFRQHLAARPVANAFVCAMIMALTAEAGALAVAGSSSLCLTLASGALGMLIAVSRHDEAWSRTRIEPASLLFIRSAALLLLASAGIATVTSLEGSLPYGQFASFLPLVGTLLFLGILARLLLLLNNETLAGSFDDAIIASLLAALLIVLLSLGGTAA